MMALVSSVYTVYLPLCEIFRVHSLRIFFNSFAGSGFRRFHIPRAFSQIERRSRGIINGYMAAFLARALGAITV